MQSDLFKCRLVTVFFCVFSVCFCEFVKVADAICETAHFTHTMNFYMVQGVSKKIDHGVKSKRFFIKKFIVNF